MALAPLLACVLSLTVSGARGAYVDLHAHPFMDDGLGTLFHGKFEGELRAHDWTAKLSSQINVESLERSELDVVVASLYAHPVTSQGGRRASIRRQIERTYAFVAAHPNWVIARSPGEALEARARGRRVLILALEGASGILETDDDLREFIDEKGIRIVTFSHLTDDHLGGAAFFRSFRGFVTSPLSWFWQLFTPMVDENGVKLNRNGLAGDGERLARKLIDRKVWIDLAHASDESQVALIPMLKKAGQPLLYTHTALRRYLKAERGIADWQLTEVHDTHGFVALMPSEEMLEGTESACADGIHRLAAQFSYVARRIGPAATSIGSDFNGGIDHLMPPKCPTGTSFDAEGMWNIGQSGAMWAALKKLGVSWPASPDEDFDLAFLRGWERVWSGNAPGKVIATSASRRTSENHRPATP